MRKAAIISALMHVSVFLAAWFGLPALFRDTPLNDQPVHVDVVMMDEQPPKPAAKPPKPEPPKPAPKPKPAAAAPPPPEPPPVPEAPKLAAVAPEPPPAPEPLPVPKKKPTPERKVEPKPAPPPVAKAPPKPRPKPKPKPKSKPKPPQDQFQTILKNLAKEKATLAREDEKKKQDRVAVAAPLPRVDRTAQARSSFDSARASAQLAAMVKQQVTPCWNIPGGAKDAQKMQIAVRIQLNRDGTLRGAPRIEDTRRMASDPFYRAMAESAARALRLPDCTPLRLPFEQYDLWKDITLIFDPSEALGP